ncbi:MAG: DUF4097 family beta strand repeat-containing protein [Candidatus Baltobacteraceae bacterium]
MNNRSALLLLLALAACSSPTPYATTTGELQPKSTMTLSVTDASVEVYGPAAGQSPRQFTIAATSVASGAQPPAPGVRRAGNGIVVTAPDVLDRLLVRAPDGVNVNVRNGRGNVSVTSITGNADVRTASGDIRIMIPGYARAATGAGHLSVTLGATQWPGVLQFANGNGDIELYIPETAKFHVRLHTDDGTLFTDFGLRGTALGNAETIDAPVNGGGTDGIDVEAKHGTIRLLRLSPQA